MKDPRLAKSDNVTETAFNVTFKTDLGYFDWLELPENEYRRKRFGTAMEGTKRSERVAAGVIIWRLLYAKISEAYVL